MEERFADEKNDRSGVQTYATATEVAGALNRHLRPFNHPAWIPPQLWNFCLPIHLGMQFTHRIYARYCILLPLLFYYVTDYIRRMTQAESRYLVQLQLTPVHMMEKSQVGQLYYNPD